VSSSAGTGTERIATDSVFELLDVPPFKRTPDAAKRLKGLMVELGCPPSGVARWTYAYRSRSVGGMRRVTLAGGTAAVDFVKALLNHNDKGVTGIYARWHMFEEKREAVMAIEAASLPLVVAR
jgi:hypothetical protein